MYWRKWMNREFFSFSWLLLADFFLVFFSGYHSICVIENIHCILHCVCLSILTFFFLYVDMEESIVIIDDDDYEYEWQAGVKKNYSNNNKICFSLWSVCLIHLYQPNQKYLICFGFFLGKKHAIFCCFLLAKYIDRWN